MVAGAGCVFAGFDGVVVHPCWAGKRVSIGDSEGVKERRWFGTMMREEDGKDLHGIFWTRHDEW